MTITTYTDREIALRQQLAAATQLAQLNGEIAAELKADKLALEAAIEASGKQEAVVWMLEGGRAFETVEADYHNGDEWLPLYAAPVVAPDVLSALKMAVLQNSHDMLMTGEEIRKCELAIQSAMGGAND